VIGFLNRLTERLRAHNDATRTRTAERLERMRNRQYGVQDDSVAANPQIQDEFKNTAMSDSSIQTPTDYQRLHERLKSGKGKYQKRVNWFVPPVTAVIAFLFIHNQWWPTTEVNEFLAGIGLRGRLFEFLPIGILIMIPVAIAAAIVTRILEGKYGKDEE
jgi:hypothetical protein